MKKHPALLLALSGTLLLSLCACGGKEPEPTPGPSESANVIVASPDTEPPESANVVVVTPEAEPTESMNVITPEESEAVVEPLASQTPDKGSELAPSPKPTETPVQTQPILTPEPAPEGEGKAPTAAEVYDKVSAVATGTYMVDSSFALDAFYPDLSEGDFEDFVLYMPDASAKIEEILIGKVVNGRMDAVKAACQSRQQGMKEESAFYTTTGDYVDSYKLVVNGDWILFAVVQNPAEAESTFNDCTK